MKITWILACCLGTWALAEKAPEAKKTPGSFVGQHILSFSQKYDYDCAPITKEVVKKLNTKTKCTKKVWDSAVPTAAPYYECRLTGGTVYISDTAKNCAQMRDWLQVD